MTRFLTIVLQTCCCFLLLHLAGCAGSSSSNSICYFSAADSNTPERFSSPAFLVENSDAPYNRIGTPSAALNDDGQEAVFVNPALPAVYVGENSFSTDRGQYTNAIYRIHFSKVPYGFPFVNLTAGNNPGILIIYTRNVKKQLLLVTTVHTCGCYLAFLPTDKLDQASYPPDWPAQEQWIYGHNLPSRITLDGSTNEQLLFTLADQTHRISDIRLIRETTSLCPARLALPKQTLRSLHMLPLGDSTTSFFHTSGPKKGYVKNNTKILEKLFISWWALDPHVGEDKEYGSEATEPIFYTSLKFWQRRSSDLRSFPAFLRYWGWNL